MLGLTCDISSAGNFFFFLLRREKNEKNISYRKPPTLFIFRINLLPSLLFTSNYLCWAKILNWAPKLLEAQFVQWTKSRKICRRKDKNALGAIYLHGINRNWIYTENQRWIYKNKNQITYVLIKTKLSKDEKWISNHHLGNLNHIKNKIQLYLCISFTSQAFNNPSLQIIWSWSFMYSNAKMQALKLGFVWIKLRELNSIKLVWVFSSFHVNTLDLNQVSSKDNFFLSWQTRPNFVNRLKIDVSWRPRCLVVSVTSIKIVTRSSNERQTVLCNCQISTAAFHKIQ